MASDIISRSDAKAKGLARYFTGKPCKHGHVAFRRTINGVCCVCLLAIEKRHRESHREAFRAKWRKATLGARKRDPEKVRLKANNWSRANRTKEAERQRRWRHENPEKYHASEKRRRDASPEKIRLKNKRYKTANADRLAPIAIVRMKQWRGKNPERARIIGRKARQHWRARLLASPGSYTQQQVQSLLETQKWLCATPRCATSLRDKKELDHIIALARGGSNDIANLQWLCPRCNRKKNDKSPEEWALICARMFPIPDPP